MMVFNISWLDSLGIRKGLVAIVFPHSRDVWVSDDQHV